VLGGAIWDSSSRARVAALTFVVHRRLPLPEDVNSDRTPCWGIVLLVMVGEQAQEMQLAKWIPTTPIKRLSNVLPAWIGLVLGVSQRSRHWQPNLWQPFLSLAHISLLAPTPLHLVRRAAVILGLAPDCPMQTLGTGQNKPEKWSQVRYDAG